MIDELTQPLSSHSPRGLTARDQLLAFVIFSSTILIYLPVVKYGFINFDDPESVYENANVLEGLTRHSVAWALTSQTLGLWKPLTVLSYMIEVQLFGVNPGLMHLDNVILHAAAAAGWYLLLSGMTGLRSESFIVGALFGMHPAHVESVAWITERKDVLSMVFMVLSLLAYWRYAVRLTFIPYTASLLCFLFALMSKALLVTQPVIMLLLDVWPLGRTRFYRSPSTLNPDQQTSRVSQRWLIAEKIPFLALAVFFALITIHFQGKTGASPTLDQLPVSQRFSTAILGYMRYLGEAFWPTNLAIYYPYQFNVPVIVAATSAVLLFIFTFVVFKFRRTRPYLLIGWIWYLVAFLPVVGFLQAGGQNLADRYTYLPFVGLSIGVVWTVADIANRSRSRHRAIIRGISFAGGLTAVVACAVCTRQYLPFWQSSIALFSKAEASNSQPSDLIEFHIADGYNDIGRPDLALEHYSKAIQLNPNSAEGHHNLANLLLLYSPQEAVPHYKMSLKLKPTSSKTHYSYAICLEQMKQNDEAAHELEIALQLDPGYVEARQALRDLQQRHK